MTERTEPVSNSSAIAAASEDTDSGYPSRTYAWAVVVLLLIAYVYAFIDRMILTLLVEPIKADLLLTDTQIGLLHGFAFSTFYALALLPIGRLVDRKSRQKIVVAGVIAWSIMTAFCGMARNFATLFVGRMGVGIGECTLVPAVSSLLTDLFPKRLRARAISLFTTGPYLGFGLSFLAGGALLVAVEKMPVFVLPFLGEMKPWQMTFIFLAIPGLLIALLVFFLIREPARRERKFEAAINDTESTSWKRMLAFAFERKRVIALLSFAGVFNIMIGYAINGWTPSYFIRTFGWEASEIGQIFGIILAVFGASGTFCGGLLGEHFDTRGRSDSFVRAMLIMAPGAILCGLMPLMPTPTLALIILAPGIFFLAAGVGLPIVALTRITPNEFRGQILSINFLIMYVFGISAGPLAVALITDYVFTDPMAVGYSIASVVCFVVPLNVACLWFCRKPFGILNSSSK